MRIKIKNCVTDPRFKDLRRNGKPVFKPLILGSVLVPGAVRVVQSDIFKKEDVAFLDSLVKSGSCTALEVGVGPVDFNQWLSKFADSLEEPVEEIVEIVEEDPIIDTESVEESVEEAVEEPAEEIIDEDKDTQDLHTKESLSDLRNADLRDIITSMDPDASTGNKSKKKLIAMVLELQNAQNS